MVRNQDGAIIVILGRGVQRSQGHLSHRTTGCLDFR